MCIICTKQYNIELIRLDCSNCTNLLKIPKELVNLKYLDCSNCINLLKIPKELVNLEVLHCSKCKYISEIPNELVNLNNIFNYLTRIKQIPKELIKLNPNVKILVISALSDYETALESISEGAQGFIYKPFSKEELLEAILGILNCSNGHHRIMMIIYCLS